jgi:hypothetical protein
MPREMRRVVYSVIAIFVFTAIASSALGFELAGIQ